MRSKGLSYPLASASCNSSKNEKPCPLDAYELRPYQAEIITAVMDSVFNQKGTTYSVEIARQGGKNEISARLQMALLGLFIDEKKNLIKCAPTFHPQAINSMVRLTDRLNDAGFGRFWKTQNGNTVCMGNARTIFLSADKMANVVGNTAHLLLEIDEAQDVTKEKYTRDFKPMGSTTNVTTVLYGTTWDDSTLLEEVKQSNLELVRKDGIRRHFRYDWQEVAKYNPSYLAYVEGNGNAWGRTIRCSARSTAYNRCTVAGDFSRLRKKRNCRAGIPECTRQKAVKPMSPASTWRVKPRKSTTSNSGHPKAPRFDGDYIGELDYTATNKIQKQPGVRIVEHSLDRHQTS